MVIEGKDNWIICIVVIGVDIECDSGYTWYKCFLGEEGVGSGRMVGGIVDRVQFWECMLEDVFDFLMERNCCRAIVLVVVFYFDLNCVVLYLDELYMV